MTITLAMPAPPTTRATAPSARKGPRKAADASARAVSVSVGLVTAMLCGEDGSTVAASTASTGLRVTVTLPASLPAVREQ